MNIFRFGIIVGLALTAASAVGGSVEHRDQPVAGYGAKGAMEASVGGGPIDSAVQVELAQLVLEARETRLSLLSDRAHFCYFEGQRFSEGAVLNGRTCGDAPIRTASALKDGLATNEDPALVWLDPKQQ